MNNNNYYSNPSIPGYQINDNQQIPSTAFKNALTDEEFAELTNNVAADSKLNIEMSQLDVIRSMCTHAYKNGQDAVRLCNDNSGDVYCPICKCRWHGDETSVDQLNKMITDLHSAFQNAKWTRMLPTQLVREFSPMVFLIKNKFEDLYNYAMDQQLNFIGRESINPNGYNAGAAYNNVLYGYGPMQPPMYYQPPMQQQTMYQQPMQQPVGMYNNPAAVQNPMQNPMQQTVVQQPINNPYQQQQTTYQQPMQQPAVFAPASAPAPTVIPTTATNTEQVVVKDEKLKL